MNKKTFAQGLAYLSLFYTTFKVDLENEMVIEVWYDTFKSMDEQYFTALVRGYCKENIFPPQSPTHLLEFAKQQLALSQSKADEEFERVRELNRRYSLRINHQTIYAKIDNPITVKIVKSMFDDFINMGEDNADSMRKRFTEKYTDLTREANQIKSNELLGTPQKKLLE
jgi:hypothetical protein